MFIYIFLYIIKASSSNATEVEVLLTSSMERPEAQNILEENSEEINRTAATPM